SARSEEFVRRNARSIPCRAWATVSASSKSPTTTSAPSKADNASAPLIDRTIARKGVFCADNCLVNSRPTLPIAPVIRIFGLFFFVIVCSHLLFGLFFFVIVSSHLL